MLGQWVTPAALGPANATANEDCLFLNVWSGAGKADELRPVMVWLHGGGFQFGTSGDPRWEGTHHVLRNLRG